MSRAKVIAFWAAPVALSLALRVPQMLGPHWIADGDESVVGLAALHALSGRGLPGFFYGQAYGFSLFEILAGAAFLQLGLDATSALKLGAWILFAAGISGWQLLGLRLTGGDRRAALAAALAVAASVSWGIWGMKLRGGYVTAFALQPWSLLLLSSRHLGWRFGGGVLAGVLALAQPMFLPGWAAWAAFLLWKERRVAGAAAVLGGVVIGAGAVRWTWPVESTYWSPGILTLPTLDTVAGGASAVLEALTGVDRAFETFSPAHDACLMLVATLGVLVVAVAIVAWRRERPGWTSLPQAWAAVALGVSLLQWPFLQIGVARYFLAAMTHLPIIAGLEWRRWPMRAWMVASAIALPTLDGVPWSRPPPSDAEEVAAVLGSLGRAGVEGVYSTSPLLQWQIMYYSGDTLPARWLHPGDRLPEYPRRVDDALWEGRMTAVVGELQDGSPVRGLPGFVVPTPGYFVLLAPHPNLLTRWGFALNPPRTPVQPASR